jgi:hypothetical protein
MWLLARLILIAGCGDGGTAGVDAASVHDAGASDVGATDAGTRDGGSIDDGGGTDAATVDAAMLDAAAADAAMTADSGPVAFTLTSPEYVEGGVIPIEHVCVAQGGLNTSPALDWVGAPAGTLSFAVFFTDATTNFRHAAIYDIPVIDTGLPADVEHAAMPTDVPGASQPHAYGGMPFGYAGLARDRCTPIGSPSTRSTSRRCRASPRRRPSLRSSRR